MFTGIVEELGEVLEVEDATSAKSSNIPDGSSIRRLRMRGDGVAVDLTSGDSVAVDGVCLTVTEVFSGEIVVDVVSETLNLTSLGGLKVGTRVNVERPLSLGGRVDGHLVQGHIDGVASIEERTSDGMVRIELPNHLGRYVASKGSIAVDGISLTVVAVDDASFTIALIPTTLAMTTLGWKDAGDLVNIEVDVMAKYLERLTGTVS